jgi:predicted Zn-dependent peptidase
LNGFTAEEATCYLVKLPACFLERGLGVLSDMVISPLLASQDIAKEKHVILEEIKMYKDLPQSYVHELLDELLWPGQALGEPIIGTEQSVSSISRAALLEYKQRHYTPSNIVVAAAGSLDHGRFVRSCRRIFSKLKSYSPTAFTQAQKTQDNPQARVFDKQTEQTHLAFGFHAFGREHRLRHAAALLHIMLGANMSSRLFNEVREKRGYAYEIGTSVKRFHDTGAFIVHAGIDNAKVTDAVILILKELKKTVDRNVGEDEIRRAKEFYRGQLMLTLEDTLEHMLWIGETTAMLNTTYSLKEMVAQINRVSRSDVREAARTLFRNDNLNLSLIGPMEKQRRRIEGALHFD